jgi:hypothetical protein
MDKKRLREAAEKLEQEVERAVSAGYENAVCVLTSEVRHLLPLAKTEQIDEPARLQFKAGPAWTFFETQLGECVALEGAWRRFCWLVEDRDSSPEIIADKAHHPHGYDV